MAALAAFNFITGSVSLVNVTLSGNRAIQGGGLYNARNRADLLNVTVFGDSGGDGSDSIYDDSGVLPVGVVTLHNTLVGKGVIGSDCFGPITSLGHNMASDGSRALSLPTGGPWYVRTFASSDLNPCNVKSLPCRTINGAIGKAANGDAAPTTAQSPAARRCW